MRDRLAAIVSVLLMLSSSAALGADESEWLKELQNDIENVEKARQKRPELHRSLVKKWSDADRLDALVDEYAARAQMEPDNAPLLYGFGYALAVRSKPGDLENAAAALIEATEIDPTFLLAYFTLGGTFLKYAQEGSDIDQNSLGQALEAYQECAIIDETFAPAQYGIAETLRVQEEFELALEHYEIALGLSASEWALPHYGMALAYEAMDDLGSAEASARLALVIDEKYASAMFLLGQLRAAQGSPQEAVELYDEAERITGYAPADELLRLARVFVETQYDDRAETYYRRAIEAAPEDARFLPETRYELGELLWRKGDKEAAAMEYKAAAELDARFENYFIEQARALYHDAEQPDETATREALDKALAVNALMPEKNSAAHLLYAEIETASGNANEAIRLYEAAAEISPDEPTIYFPLGDLLYANGERERAGEAFRKAAELNPDEARKYAEYAEGVYATGRLDEAAQAWDKHLMIHPGDASARYWLARSYEENEKTEQALEHYETLRANAPDTEDALFRLSKIYVAQERSEEALEVMHELIALRPNDPDAHYMLGETLFALNDHERALPVYQRVVEIDETHASAHEKIGQLLEPTDPEAAEAAYLRVVELEPERPNPYFRLAKISLDRQDEETGMERLKLGLERDPNRPDEQYTLASLLDKRGKLTEAMPHYAVSVKLKPEMHERQYEYARCAHRVAEAAKDAEEREAALAAADAAYSAAIEIEPTADRHYWRGRLRFEYRQLGEELHLMSDVADDFRAVVKLEPKRLEARYWLGKTFVEMEQEELARQTFQNLLKLDAKYPEANTELGLLEEKRREYDAAMRFFHLELKVNPKSYMSHRRLGFLYMHHVVDPSLGAEHLGKATELNPTDAEAFFEYGRALYEISQLRLSARAFEKAVKLNPAHITANYNLATVYEYLDKPKLAAARLRHLLTLEGVPGEWRIKAQEEIKRLEALSGE